MLKRVKVADASTAPSRTLAADSRSQAPGGARRPAQNDPANPLKGLSIGASARSRSDSKPSPLSVSESLLVMANAFGNYVFMSSSAAGWDPPSPQELQHLLPQYEISEILGHGGMGAVYKGRQAKLNRAVAIKLLPETFTKGEDELDFASRFEQEAQAMAGLDHPAIVSVYDFGETAEGQLYFVMEFVDGMDVHQYLQHHGGRLPQEHAVSITAHVLDALDYAHSHGVIHRDIKPANILLNREGRVKIADFGLAKRFGEVADASTPALTMANVALGTPDYVAPETLDREQTPDHRADLYAVGVMLYQMLTGKLPRGMFESPSELNAEIDPRLDDIVAKAMAANPDYRYASAEAVRADLDRVLSEPPAKVEAGEDSAAVAAAVPVTNRVRGVPKPAARKGSMGMLYGGIGLAATVVAGILVLAMGDKESGSESGTGVPPVASMGKATESGQGNLEETAGAPPAETIGTLPMPSDGRAEPSEQSGQEPGTASADGQTPLSEASDEEMFVMPPPFLTEADPASERSGGTPEPPSPDAETAVETAPTPESDPGSPSPLAAVPGVTPRLNAYLEARREQVGDLAANYARALGAQIDRTADSGDLPLVEAFRAERNAVEALLESLAAAPEDPAAAVLAAAPLPELPENAPEALSDLRETWTAAHATMRAELDTKLDQSLAALERELTREREFEQAAEVLAFRATLSVDGADPVGSGAPAMAAGEAADDPTTDNPLRATKDEPFENSLGMRFVPVPGTDVLFCIHETRWRDYAAYAEDKPGINAGWRNQTHDGFVIEDSPEEHPVVYVSWEDAKAFCEWLSEKEGKTYRLPTDREWSIAAGIGREERWWSDTTPETVNKPEDIFPWGKDWPPPEGAGNYSDESRREKAPRGRAGYLDGYDDGYPTTAPVMRFAPNEHGLYDMGGNVWEWVEDWWNDSKEHRVLRGGSWFDGVRGNLPSSHRSPFAPDDRDRIRGFRVVLVSSRG